MTINYINSKKAKLTMVNKMFLHPQEIETFYILPTLRSYFARFLKERGMKQKDIAHLLMINSATISQYTSSKRGNKISFNEFTLKKKKKSAKNLHAKFFFPLLLFVYGLIVAELIMRRC